MTSPGDAGGGGLLGTFLNSAFQRVVDITQKVTKSKSKWGKAKGRLKMQKIKGGGKKKGDKVHPYAPSDDKKGEGITLASVATEGEDKGPILPQLVGWNADSEKQLLKLWDAIDGGATALPPPRKVIPRRYGEWVTARVFISSTFTDTFAERECLLKRVLPEIRRRAEKLHIHIQDTDLRWGVPPDSSAEFTIRKCLSEIDRCFQDNHERPFFVCLLSERFGWCPGPSDVPAAVKKQWDWQDTLSITSHEILHGAYRKANPNALFLLRDGDFEHQEGFLALTEGERAMFVDRSRELKYKMKVLKERLVKKFGPTGQVLENYPCQVGGMDHQGKIRLRGLEKFQGWCTERLWDAIVGQYGELSDAPGSEGEGRMKGIVVDGATQRTLQATLMHRIFIEQKTKSFVGRVAILQDMLQRTQNLFGGKDAGRANIMIVTGASGAGKSACMAKHTSQCMHDLGDSTAIFFHFTGVAPGSTSFDECIKRLIRELQKHLDPRLLQSPLPADYGDLLLTWHEHVKAVARKGKLLLIFDAVDQFEDEGRVLGLRQWLPLNVPNVAIVLSINPGPVFDTLRVLGTVEVFGIQEVVLPAMTREEQTALVSNTLGFYNKELNAGQMGTLLDKKGSSNVLWLMLAIEELHVFGIFEKVNAKITGMKDDVQGIFEQVLLRLEQELGLHLVRDCMALLACSRDGLLEQELRDLLSQEPDEPLPSGKWSELYNSISFCMRPPGQGEEGTIDFFHQQLVVTVQRRYLQARIDGLEAQVYYHRRLAMYFKTVAMAGPTADSAASFNDCPRSLRVLSHHQRRAQLTLDVMVAVRCRPMNKREIEMGARCIVTMEGSRTTIVNPEMIGGAQPGNNILSASDRGLDLGGARGVSAPEDLANGHLAKTLPSDLSTQSAQPRKSIVASRSLRDMSESRRQVRNSTGGVAGGGGGDDGGMVTSFNYDFSLWSCTNASCHLQEEAVAEGHEIPIATQATVFNMLGVEVLQNAFDGFNVSFFTYGQTGSGKTYSIFGAPDDKGLVPHVCKELFQRIKESQSPDVAYTVKVSMIEIYREKVFDLLNKAACPPGGLVVRADNNKVHVEGLEARVVSDFESIDAAIKKGDESREMASTVMNDSSSRSHTLVSVTLTQTRKSTSEEKSGRVWLVDLAGSERTKAREAEVANEERRAEGVAINKSLTVLNRCIKGMAQGSKNADSMPFRDSKLTLIMREALSGGSKILMLAAISPAEDSYPETLSTLKYASMAKRIGADVAKKRKNENAEEADDAAGKASAEESFRLADSLSDILQGSGSQCPILVKMVIEARNGLKELVPAEDSSAAAAPGIRSKPRPRKSDGGGKKKGKFGSAAKKMKALAAGGLFGVGGGAAEMPGLEQAKTLEGDEEANGEGKEPRVSEGMPLLEEAVAEEAAAPAEGKAKKKKLLDDGSKKKAWQDIKQLMAAKTKPERLSRLLTLLGLLFGEKSEITKNGAEACGQKVLKETPQRIVDHISDLSSHRINRLSPAQRKELHAAATCPDVIDGATTEANPALRALYMWCIPAHMLSMFWMNLEKQDIPPFLLKYWRRVGDTCYRLLVLEQEGAARWELGAGGARPPCSGGPSDEEVSVVGAWLQRSAVVKSVDLTGHRMTAAAVDKLCSAAVGCTSLQVLSVSECGAGACGSLHAAKSMAAKPGFRVEFTLDDNASGAPGKLSKRDTAALVSLVRLAHSEHAAGDGRIYDALFDAIGSSDSYTAVQAMWLMNIEHQKKEADARRAALPPGAAPPAAALIIPAPSRFTSSTVSLSMAASISASVPTKAIDCHVLGKYLSSDKAFKKLAIDGANQVDDTGALELARALRENDALEEIDVRNNKVGDAGAMALLSVVRDRGLVRVIEMENNPLGQVGWAELVRTMVFKEVHALSPIVDAALSNCPELCEQLVRAMYGQERHLGVRPGHKNWTVEEAILAGGVLQTGSLPSVVSYDVVEGLHVGIPVGGAPTPVNLSGKELGGAAGIIAAAFCGRGGCPVPEVDVSHNDIGEAGVDAFGRMLATQDNAMLTVLRLGHQKSPVSDKAIECLAEGIKSTKFLEVLCIPSVGLSVHGCKLLAESLRGNKSVRLLDVGYNAFGAPGARQFFNVLAQLPEGPLRDLRLAGVDMGRQGVESLRGARGCLARNRSLERLDVQGNGLVLADMVLLAEALLTSSTLMYINVAGTDLPVHDLAGVAGRYEVDLADCALGDHDAVVMARLATGHSTASTLKVLRLRGNKFGPASGLAFAEMLRKNKSLEVLDLKGNKVEQAGAIALAGALKTNRTLLSLNIQGNDLGADGGMAIVNVLSENELIACKVGGQWLGNEDHAWED